MEAKRKTLTQLSVPICLETLFYMLSGMVDTLMLSSVSDQAVGAVGTANTYIGVFIIMFGVISSGMIAVMSQNIGAGRPGIAYQARQLGLIFNALIGIVMSVVLATFSGGILRIVSIAPALLEPAEIYLRIVGGACFLNALIPIFSSYLRVFGYTKHSLIGTVVGNVLNIILNSVFLFAFNWGVMGVAVATVISRVVNLIIVAGMGAVLIKAKQSPERITSRKIFAQIVKIGFPSALETALYNIAMTFIVRFMNQMDADGMNVTARSYAIQIANFSYCVGAALAQANAIMTGWRIGAKEFEECNRGTRKAAIYGIITATCFSVTFAFAGHFIVHIFTDDIQMINLVVKLLIVDIFLEYGRVITGLHGRSWCCCTWLSCHATEILILHLRNNLACRCLCCILKSCCDNGDHRLVCHRLIILRTENNVRLIPCKILYIACCIVGIHQGDITGNIDNNMGSAINCCHK